MKEEDMDRFKKSINIKNCIEIEISETFQSLWYLNIKLKNYLSNEKYNIWFTPEALKILIDLLKEIEKYI